MPYSYIDNIATADIAFRAWGRTIEEMFAAAADATLNVMADDLAAIEAKEERAVSVKDEKLDLLLYKFLQEIVFFKDAQQLLLRIKELRLAEEADHFVLHAQLAGEKIDPSRHRLKVDVKAITLHQLKVVKNKNSWEATVVVDI